MVNVGAMLSDDQVVSLLRSQRECKEELGDLGEKFDTLVDLSGEIQRLSMTQIQAAEERAAETTKLAELTEKQRVDDDERTQREGARKTLVLIGKIGAPVLALILLPLATLGASWLVDDYEETREAVATHQHEIEGVIESGERDRTSASATAGETRENRDSIERIEGRLEGIEGGQGDILEAIESSRRRRR